MGMIFINFFEGGIWELDGSILRFEMRFVKVAARTKSAMRKQTDALSAVKCAQSKPNQNHTGARGCGVLSSSVWIRSVQTKKKATEGSFRCLRGGYTS